MLRELQGTLMLLKAHFDRVLVLCGLLALRVLEMPAEFAHPQLV